ncbi:UDP:flavonoid glycosyltransferase YjiC (YdhE family) [Streptomyces umbrinus]|uniref:UDP:flavonoid glycosyltransferase YjiC (YdhE family) n=1 Tax=Streptomyces umbrinus TaxID=67370 RepID=A0ABU0SK69_9ACTN|nr:glycosyltransferase [Streptomyces umbrinus]MDQ1023832.1 UDP:flavonoid glycosyltransferase YjiC (YdhE family) [Streptomyces umbrinus]
MSGFLFVVPPLVGHINPTVGVATELTARGHRVAWASADPGLVRRLAGDEAVVFPCAGPVLTGEDGVRPADLRGPEALKFLWERFLVPLAEAMAPGVRAAIGEFGPDVVVADQQAFAGGVVAERLRVPWATSSTTSAEFTFADALTGMPKVADWLDRLLHDLRGRIGDPSGTADPRFSPHLVLAFSTPELVGAGAGAGSGAGVGDRIRWVGPSMAPRPAAADFPWTWLDPARATVLVTLGTANTDVGARFLAECRDALRCRADRVQAVIVDPANVLGVPPDLDDKDVLIRSSVPQLPLLERVDAVVCHAGHNTVCEALWHGVPLVVAPIRDDQPVVAGQVVDAGAGIRVRFGRVTAPKLGAAIDAVLHEPGHRTAAERIRTAFRAAGGAGAAAIHLEELAGATPSKEAP